LEILVPRVLNVLEKLNLKITVFIVGQDAALTQNREMLQAIARAGHEIGNHSFRHEPWLHLYSEPEIEAEVASAEDHIGRVTGQRPVGFRGPGFSISLATLRILAQRGYLYDASTLPSVIAPMARLYYLTTGKFNREERRKRKVLGGTLSDALRPIKPYHWCIDSKSLIEIPVTTMPLFRVPMHVSYLQCLNVVSSIVARKYFNVGLKLCRLTGTPPSLLLHPTDFLGSDDTRDLSFFPAMSLPSDKKLELVDEVLDSLTAEFTVLTIGQAAQEAAKMSDLPLVEPGLLGV
jgi:hypothetical protein